MVQKLPGKRTSASYSNPAPTATERAVYIRPEVFGVGFDVVITPALDDGRNFDRECRTYREARGYSGGLRLSLGLRVIDETDGGAA